MSSSIDPKVRDLAIAFVERTKTGRAVKALQAILNNGAVTTAELSELGYDHPPRAIADIKDHGIPILTTMVKSSSGRRMASYSLGSASEIRAGQVGRTSFSKKFRSQLIDRYGPVDEISQATHDPRVLQIDHRVPYRIGGDADLVTGDVEAFMLLDAKSQRAKSWSCEHCQNYIVSKDPAVCKGCFWAYPADYSHVAMQEIRRIDLVWQGAEIIEFEAMNVIARANGTSIADLLKALGRDASLNRK